MAGLVRAGIELVDVQAKNSHSAQFNVTMIANEVYLDVLTKLKEKPVVLQGKYFNYDTAISFLKY